MSNAGVHRAPIDPNVVIPEAVKRSSARSDALHAEAYRDQNAPPADVTPPPAEAAPAPAPVAAAPAPAPAIAPASTEQPPPRSETVDPNSWEARYYSMDGRVRAMARNETIMRDQITRLEELLATSHTETTEPARTAENTFLTPADRENYGEDMVDMVQRAAREMTDRELAPLKAELATLKGNVTQTTNLVAARSKNEMMASLDKSIPEWRTYNNAEEFHAWAELPDIYSGVKRIELLREAFGRFETPRVQAIFEGFKNERHATAPAPATALPAQSGPTVTLESLAAPGRTASSPAPTGGDKPIYTRAQIAQFYRDVQARRYEGREAEKATKEKDIFDAQAEGRIRG